MHLPHMYMYTHAHTHKRKSVVEVEWITHFVISQFQRIEPGITKNQGKARTMDHSLLSPIPCSVCPSHILAPWLHRLLSTCKWLYFMFESQTHFLYKISWPLLLRYKTDKNLQNNWTLWCKPFPGDFTCPFVPITLQMDEYMLMGSVIRNSFPTLFLFLYFLHVFAPTLTPIFAGKGQAVRFRLSYIYYKNFETSQNRPLIF